MKRLSKKNSEKVLSLQKLTRHLLITMFAVLLGGCAITQQVEMTSFSMEPTLHEGQSVRILPVGDEPLLRNEVILFADPLRSEEMLIKRIVGLPGETVEIVEGLLFINGERLAEAYPVVPNLQTEQFGPVLIGDDAYFVLGDNRPNSLDSRTAGSIPRKEIMGKVVLP